MDEHGWEHFRVIQSLPSDKKTIFILIIVPIRENIRGQSAAKLELRTLMSTRREKIEAMLTDDPTDTFLRYSLAMELDKEGEHDQSLAKLSELTEDQPPYVPAFFMAGQQLTRLDRISEARTILRAGIEQARAQSDLHAAGEMSEFLASLGNLGE